MPAVAVAIFVWRATVSQARANVQMAEIMRVDFENRERPYVHVSDIDLLAHSSQSIITTPIKVHNVGPVPAVITALIASYNKPGTERNPPLHSVAVFPGETHPAEFTIRWEGPMPIVDPRLEITIVVNYRRLGACEPDTYFTEHRYRIDWGTPDDRAALFWATVSTSGA